jgi:hypothetical protein
MPLVSSFVVLVQQMGAGLTSPSLGSLLTVVRGWVWAGRRCVTGMLVAAGAHVGAKHFSAYHRLFSSARWSLDGVGLALYALLEPLLVPGEAVALTLDDTLARKRGKKVWGAGMHHDPLISSRRMKLVNWGHSWVVLAVRVALPGCPGRVFSLPVFVRLYLTPKGAARWRVTYRKRTELAVQLLRLLCRSRPGRHFHVFADSTYGCQDVLRALPPNCDLTARLHLEARLCRPLAPQQLGRNGRPRVHGERLPSPRQMLAHPRAARRLTLALYGRRDRVRLLQTHACSYHVPRRLLRVVVVEPLTGGRRPQAFFSTRTDWTAERVLAEYAGRWSIEEAFLAAKQHLGLQEPPGWSKQAVLRTAPLALLLYSLTLVWFASEGQRHYLPAYRPWNRKKTRPSFADMLATLKQQSLAEALSHTPAAARTSDNLLATLCTAANAAA